MRQKIHAGSKDKTGWVLTAEKEPISKGASEMDALRTRKNKVMLRWVQIEVRAGNREWGTCTFNMLSAELLWHGHE